MRFVISLMLAGAAVVPALAQTPTGFELVGVKKIWDQAPHNAFTDLVRFKDRWYCVFREGQKHVSPDGALRVLTSADGDRWESAALLSSKDSDLRDAKIAVTPDGKLMLGGAGALHKKEPHSHQSLVWFSDDGKSWSEPTKVGDPGYWLWRVTPHEGAWYGVGYGTGSEPRQARLYRSADGKTFTRLVDRFRDEGYPNEATVLFQPDDTALCLLRRDGKPNTGLLGTAKPPYTDWTWKDLGVQIGGPNLIRLPDGRLVAVVRLYDKKVRTAVCALDADGGKLTEVLALPSGGDTSYAGLVWHDGLLWVSYYSSHEKLRNGAPGKTSIYLAKVKVS
ncbi:MAG TPA: sialidase family protein [Fimbriiglobus sp.]|nr:sialidase family protein [Fimbriiglobus sp.]